MGLDWFSRFLLLQRFLLQLGQCLSGDFISVDIPLRSGLPVNRRITVFSLTDSWRVGCWFGSPGIYQFSMTYAFFPLRLLVLIEIDQIRGLNKIIQGFSSFNHQHLKVFKWIFGANRLRNLSLRKIYSSCDTDSS